MHERRYDGDADRLRSDERMQRLQVEQVIQLSLEGIHPSTLLDVGTGSGVFAEAFSKNGLTVTGLDVNLDMLKMARKAVPDALLTRGLAEYLPFKNKTFDVIFYGLVFHETDDFPLTLREAIRTSAQRAVILEWPYLEQDFGPPLNHRLKKEQIISLATKAGFAKTRVFELNHLLLYRCDL